MSHAAGMLVAAMEHDDRAARHTSHRWPVAIEQIDAVVGPEGPLFYWPHGDSEPAFLASPTPARTRFTTVRTSKAASAGTAHLSHAGIGAKQPIHKPRAPKTTARSLLPIAPTERHQPSTVRPSTTA